MLDGSDDAAQRIVVSEGVAAVGRQFANIVPRRKDFGAAGRAENDDAHLLPLHFFEAGAKAVDEFGAEGVALARIVEGDDSNVAVYLCDDQSRWCFHCWCPLP